MAGYHHRPPGNSGRLGNDLSAESIRAQLAKILQSRTLSQAPVLSRLLRYLVEHAIQGNADHLKEYSVGVEVFGRGDSFDPRIDTIVRVQARRLRSKLAEYYKIEGCADQIVFELPKGHYLVIFLVIFRCASLREHDSKLHPFQNLEAHRDRFDEAPEQVAALRTPALPAPAPSGVDEEETDSPAETCQVAPVRNIHDVAPQPVPGAPAAVPPGKLSRRWLVLSGILACLVLMFAPVLRKGQPERGLRRPIQSLAVLPLDNLSGHADQQYFVDGMTDALISNLGKIGALRVISRTSAMRYKGAKKPLSQIAKELDVLGVVEGSVLQVGNRVRITVQLIEAETDRQVWTDSYERDLSEVLALQSEVAQAIAREIKIAVTDEEGKRVASVRPVSQEAQDCYLRGHYFLRKRTEEGFRKAIESFERATAEDPSYAPAYAGLADSYNLLAGYEILPPREAYPKARAAAIKALQIDDRLAEAHLALAMVRVRYDWDWVGAQLAFRRAIESNPGNAQGHHWYGYFSLMATTGRFQEALSELEIAKGLDPLSLNINSDIGFLLYLMGQHDQAAEQVRRTIELEPEFAFSHLVFGRINIARGAFGAGIEELEKAFRLSRTSFYMGNLGYGYAMGKRTRHARKVVEELKQLRTKQYVSAFQIAKVYAGLEESDRAFEWLEKAYDERVAALCLIKVTLEFRNLRQDRRFGDLLRRMNYPRE